MAKGVEGREVNPLNMASCVTGNGMLSERFKECTERKPGNWEIIRVSLRPDGYLQWVLYLK